MTTVPLKRVLGRGMNDLRARALTLCKPVLRQAPLSMQRDPHPPPPFEV